MLVGRLEMCCFALLDDGISIEMKFFSAGFTLREKLDRYQRCVVRSF